MQELPIYTLTNLRTLKNKADWSIGWFLVSELGRQADGVWRQKPTSKTNEQKKKNKKHFRRMKVNYNPRGFKNPKTEVNF